MTGPGDAGESLALGQPAVGRIPNKRGDVFKAAQCLIHHFSISWASSQESSPEQSLSQSRLNFRSPPTSHLMETMPGDRVNTIHHYSDPATFDQGNVDPVGNTGGHFHFHNQMFMYHFLLPFLLPIPLLFLFEQNVFKHPLSPH